MPEKHAKFSASKSAMWLACPGSLTLGANAKPSSTSYAREGTAAHQLLEWCLTQNKDALDFKGKRIPVEHETFEVDEDMARHVQVTVDLVRDIMAPHGDDAVLMAEQVVRYGELIGAGPHGWGTADVTILLRKQREIVGVDLKYGRGEEVSADGNSQLRLYGLGALAKFDESGTEFDTFRGIISQPRLSAAPSEERITVEELLAFAAEAKVAVSKCNDAEQSYKFGDMTWEAAYLNPGEKQCRWCPAKATCPELRNVVAKTVFDSQPATPEDFAELTASDEAQPAEYDGDWLAACMAKADMIEGWLTAIRAETERRLLANQPVEGFKLVRGKQGNRAWSNAEEAEAMLKGFRLKREQMYDFKLISPTTAEKLAPKYDKDGKIKTGPEAPPIGHRRWLKLKEIITRAEGKIHVAPATDPRETYTPVSANDFEDTSSSDNPGDEFA